MADPSRRQRAFGSRATIIGLLLACLPQAAEAGGRLHCKGVVTFADAMTRAVIMSLDLDHGTAYMPSCARYAELHRFCHGDILRADDHQFRFGGVESVDNTRLAVALYRDDAAASAGYDPSRLKVVFVGRCGPVAIRSNMRLQR
jgi:hypothetical protein